MITITAKTNSSSTYFFGRSFSAAQSTSGYGAQCSDTSGSDCDTNGVCNYTLNCYVPRQGKFVVTAQDDTYISGSISYTFTNCPAGMGGYRCAYPEAAFNVTALMSMNQVVNIPYNATGQLNYYQNIFYVDVPANYVGNDLIFTFSSPSSSYLLVRPNGYPEYNSPYGYEDSSEYQSFSGTDTAVWGLTQFDFVRQSRYYFALLCVDSTDGACNITISLNSSSPSSSSSGVSTTGATPITTGTTTAGVTTGTTTAGVTTGTTTAGVTTGSTTGITTRSGVTTGLTTAAPSVTTAALKSGFEVIVPSIALLLIAMLF
jgi:hypothetical protein